MRGRVLGEFAANGGLEADGQCSPRSWLIWQARVTRGAAQGSVGWVRRFDAHPQVADALADGEISESWARCICDWCDRLPEQFRADADQILLAAAAGGADLPDLFALAEEMLRRCALPDTDGDDGFARRGVTLATHFRGAGKLDGDLTPECNAALTAVLESLGKKAGPEDDRTKAQRDHDALEEACRRVIAAGGMPDRAGQPTQIQLHATLDQLPGPASSSGPTELAQSSSGGSPGGLGQSGSASPSDHLGQDGSAPFHLASRTHPASRTPPTMPCSPSASAHASVMAWRTCREALATASRAGYPGRRPWRPTPATPRSLRWSAAAWTRPHWPR